jgi:hypothetical protein
MKDGISVARAGARHPVLDLRRLAEDAVGDVSRDFSRSTASLRLKIGLCEHRRQHAEHDREDDSVG